MKTLFLAALILLTSCISNNYEPTTIFDIRPKYDVSPVLFDIKSVSLEAPYSSKVTFKQGNQLIEQEFSRWSSTPEKMLYRYWSLLPKAASTADITGIVRVFEINLDEHTADIVFDYQVKGTWRQIVIREKISDTDIESAVSSMKKAVESLTLKIKI
ncbi:MAG: PqiC family protein [Lentisphaeraceae bacterium]|nr:PqiC family protein [Lentisphaeraceae bacterium]